MPLGISHSKKYVAFDIETAKVIPIETDDWSPFRPLGIACAATLTSDGNLTLWHSQDGDGKPAAQMSPHDLQRLVRHLQEATHAGYTIYSWNGLGFDFDILAEESGMYGECRDLALNHIDMMLHFFCLKGFAVGLDKVAKGMSLPGKPAGISGAMAPKLWSAGQFQDVLDYVAQDVRAVLGIAQAVESKGEIRWITARGSKSSVPIATWLKGREALSLPLPDVSWMNAPWSRSKFAGWTKRAAETG